jgi:protein gp37
MSNEPVVHLAHHAFKPWWGYKKFPLIQDTSRWPTREYAPDPAGIWKPEAQARFLSDMHWSTPVQWNNAAAARNQRERVLCAPTPDLFQYHDDLPTWRPRLLDLIAATPSLDWLLLSRHAYAIKRVLPKGYTLPHHTWLGAHVMDQHRADSSIPYLQAVPTAGVRFLYCEPLLERIDIRRYLEPRRNAGRIDWVVCGGQSRNGAEPMHPEWVESLLRQCQEAGVPFFFKQWGIWTPLESVDISLVRAREVIEAYQQPEDRSGVMARVSKRAAGRMLNGRTWDQFPESGRAE